MGASRSTGPLVARWLRCACLVWPCMALLSCIIWISPANISMVCGFALFTFGDRQNRDSLGYIHQVMMAGNHSRSILGCGRSRWDLRCSVPPQRCSSCLICSFRHCRQYVWDGLVSTLCFSLSLYLYSIHNWMHESGHSFRCDSNAFGMSFDMCVIGC